MSKFLRFFSIFHTIGRFRLDTLLNTESCPPRLKFLLLIFKCYPETKQSRGKQLRYAFEELGPIFVKFGQLLSTRPDLIPDDVIEELNQLQDNVTPFDNHTFRAIVEKSLNASVEEVFQSFDEQPLASASIAQVHAAVLKDGQEVIVKAVRPEIEKTIGKDIDLLRFIATLVEKFIRQGKRLKPVEIVDDYQTTIFDELDLMREAANASQLRRNFLNSRLLYVPEVYWQYTSHKVMVMERIYGIQVSAIDELKNQQTDLKLLAERGVEIFFTQVFEHNFFHADMHPGNVFVAKKTPDSPSYIAVDMAIMGSLNRADQYYLARNLLAMFRRDYRQVAELHVLSGWVPKETSISGFESAIRAVCEPIFEKPLKDISFGEALITLFKTAQRFNMPVQSQLVLLQKTLLNIEGLGRQLYPDLNLWDTAHPYLEKWLRERFHPKALWKDLKHHAPEWMEKLPQVPHLVFDTLSEVKALAEIAPELQHACKTIALEKEKRPKNKRNAVLGGLLIAAGFYLAMPYVENIPTEALVLAVIGLVFLLNR